MLNNINISGPINIVRLEGEVDKEKKILYLFFDVHVSDTKCKEYDSLDIVQLFNKFIDESKNYKNEWDLFIENDVNIKNIKDVIDKSHFTGNYIQELINFFHNKFTEDINNKIRTKNNIRYHFFDIRIMNNFQDIFRIKNPNDKGYTEDTDRNSMRYNFKPYKKKVRYDGIFSNKKSRIIECKLFGTEPIFSITETKFKKITNKDAKILNKSKIDWFISDHFGVYCELVLS